MQQQMSMGGPQAADPGKAFQAQMEALEVVEHKFLLDDVESRLLEAHGLL